MKKLFLLTSLLSVVFLFSCKKHPDFIEYKAIVFETSSPKVSKNDTVNFRIPFGDSLKYTIGGSYSLEFLPINQYLETDGEIYDKSNDMIGSIKKENQINHRIRVIILSDTTGYNCGCP